MLSISSFGCTCPYHLSLLLLIPTQMASTLTLLICTELSTTHPSDHPHLHPFHPRVVIGPHRLCLTTILYSRQLLTHAVYTWLFIFKGGGTLELRKHVNSLNSWSYYCILHTQHVAKEALCISPSTSKPSSATSAGGTSSQHLLHTNIAL